MHSFLLLVLCSLLAPLSAIVVSGGGGGGRGRGFDSSSSSDSHEHGRWHSHSHERPSRPPRPPRPPTPPRRQCEAGWQRFDRPSGPWCMRVVNSIVDYYAADAQCRSFGARLSGLQNLGEIGYATGEVLKFQTSGSLWIGASRTSQCMGMRIGGGCTRDTSFQWTDGVTTGTAGFNWDFRMPDNYGARQQNCALLLASGSPVRVGAYTYTGNYLDDSECNGIAGRLRNTPRRIFGFICGKRPSGVLGG